MARKKTPPRNADGTFRKGRATARKSSSSRSRTRSRARRSSGGRKRYSNNPKLTTTLRNGVVNAGLIVAGEAASRTVPRFLPVPQTGVVGLTVKTVVALAVGMVAEQFLTRPKADMIVAGALSVPMRDLIATANIPVISEAVTPGLSAYVQAQRMGAGSVAALPASRNGRLAAYVQNRTRYTNGRSVAV